MKRAAIDASAWLAFLGREPGGEKVAEWLGGSLISAVNYSEVLQKTLALGASADRVQAAARAFSVTIVPFEANSARRVAELALTTRSQGISLADRACLALGLAEKVPVVTADRYWQTLGLDVELILIRGAEH